MSPDQAASQLRSIAKFQVTKFQYFLASVAILAVLGLGVSSIMASNSNVAQTKILSNVETPAASIIFTQRETLVYATRLAQWANGGTTRREVQIARNILAQRLAVIDTSGRSMGSRAQANYWKVLKNSDSIVAKAVPGILPEKMQREISAAVSPVIDEILNEARRLVVSYQRTVDKEMLAAAEKSAQRGRLNLIFFYIFIFFGGLFLFLNVLTNFRNYRLARVTLELEQKRLDDTIAELRRAQSTVIELQDLNVAKNAFISTVNHELRTPLTSIIGYLEIIEEGHLANGNSELAGYLEVLNRNAQILLHLVESMLTLSRIDATEGKLPDQKVSMNEVIDNAIFIMKPAFEKSKITINFTSESEHFVAGDVGQLNQIFINLLGNAIKFSPEGSEISILLDESESKEGEHYVRATISDQGIGIPADDIEHLFTRFFRAKNADSGQYPGTGLGLSIVQQVVSRHNGLIHVASDLGKGTTFVVEIPVYISSEDQLILARRDDVLSRAIAAIEKSTPENIKAVTHEMGGAIGFYGFEEAGREIIEYSRSLDANPVPLNQFPADKTRILDMLYVAANRIKSEQNG